MAGETVYHIARAVDWQTAQATGEYRVESLASEGFIHCSTREQVAATADRVFRGREDLILLLVDVDRVGAEVRYELSDGQTYPHIYGVLPVAAVVAVRDFSPGPDGRFRLPEGAVTDRDAGR